MGIVYLADDLSLHRRVALKVMRPALAADAAVRQRFLREARACAAVKHEHVVELYAVEEDRGVPFMVMQYLEGEPLNDRLRREGPLPASEVVRIGRETAEALAAAHERGLIHRDVKPANIWLQGEPGPSATGGRVKILDFGLVRALDGDSALTRTGYIVGSPAYMAPEQTGKRPIDGRCDLFSLGCVLYEAAVGERPFQGDGLMGILASVIANQPAPPAERNPAVPPALSDLILRLLSKDPAGRPASARETADALRAIQEQDATTLLPGAPSPLSPGGRGVRGRRGPWAWIAAGAAAALIGLGVAVALHFGTKRAPDEVHAEAPPPSPPPAPVADPPPHDTPPPPDKPPDKPPPPASDKPPQDTVDLLDQIDLKHDVVGGHFDKKDGVLVADRDSYVKLPLSPPAEYNLELTVERTAATEDMPLYIGYPVKGGTALLIVDEHGRRGGPSVSRVVPDFGAPSQETPVVHEGTLLRSKTPARLLIDVREKSVRVFCDDQLILHWKGDLKWLTKADQWQIPDTTVRELGAKRVTFLGCVVPFRISKMTLTPFVREK